MSRISPKIRIAMSLGSWVFIFIIMLFVADGNFSQALFSPLSMMIGFLSFINIMVIIVQEKNKNDSA
ncbi:hypothetical protein [Corynebacterium lowii]|uniref:Uncharacterized protein n=1 Tax=Corynebacterium lowii TaxID=1544413 RepID=A0A0Q0YJK8_9CORY|nr:hypothetical protein [Corynebacterium lowii]KQB87001.1 hypothetical protein Clow_00046 [Corynebacterium lowii]MDP9852418.1 hypothetical protein [Corynebacterium lowii]